MDKTWITIGLGVLGFLLTWSLMVFQAGRAVGQAHNLVKKEMELERNARIEALEVLNKEVEDQLKTSEHRYGEVGTALRVKITDVENYIREVEIWGRDHYVQKVDLRELIDQLRADFKDAVNEIKKDMRAQLENKRLQ